MRANLGWPVFAAYLVSAEALALFGESFYKIPLGIALAMLLVHADQTITIYAKSKAADSSFSPNLKWWFR